MPKYIKQIADNDCAVVAMINLLIWLKAQALSGASLHSRAVREEVSEALRLRPIGVLVYWINVFLNKLSRAKIIGYAECTPMHYWELSNWVSDPKVCAIFWYSVYCRESKEWADHTVLITDFDGKEYTAINMTEKLVDKIPIKEMKKYFRSNRNPRGWLILDKGK